MTTLIQDKLRNYLPAPVALIGYGISTQAAERLLRLCGYAGHEIAVFDKDIQKSSYASPEELLAKFAPQSLLVSPGFPLQSAWIQNFRSGGKAVRSELSVAALGLENEIVVSVSGSLGKSTTVSLIGEGLKATDAAAFVGGNLGFPLAAYVADLIEKKRPRARYIALELSSFQLENLENISFAASALTSFCPNHLERYADLQAYYRCKWSLRNLTRGPLVLNEESPDLKKFVQDLPVAERGEILWASHQKSLLSDEKLRSALLPGKHNADNIAVAAAVLSSVGFQPRAMEALLKFRGLPHRMEALGWHAGIRFFNDSKATSLESLNTAVHSLLEESSSPLWCLVGGRDKKLPWEQLSQWKSQDRLSFVFFGEAGPLIAQKSGLSQVPIFPTLRRAVEELRVKAKKGDTVLLSPGGTSLDEFKNFEDRGEKFKAWVGELFA